MALAHGYALPFEALRRTGVLAQNTADATNRATADGATKEAAGSCLDARALEVQQRTVVQPSILVVPQLTRNGVVLNQLPNTRTNFIQNNTMVGATGSVRPNLWDIGSLPSGFTVSYSASGQTTAADGTLVDYIDVTVSGTALASGFLNLRQTTSPSPVSGNLLFASGMTYTASVYLALLSGSLTGVATNVMALQEIANTTFVANTTFAPVTGITSELTRFTGTRTIEATGGADRTSVRWGHSIVSGTSYDYTVRIASPQLEKGSVATPVIRTASDFVTVDMLGVARDGAPPDFTVSRNTTATRVNSSGLIESVASGVPRIDWLGQSCPGLLVEASGQNVLSYSEEFDNAVWAKSGMTISTGTTAAFTAPDGTTNADKIIATTASGVAHAIQRSGLASAAYTFSVFAKAGEESVISLWLRNNAVRAEFNLVSGTISNITVTSARIENYGNGWYRCSVYDSTAGTTATVYGRGGGAYTGNGVDGFYLWGAQVEANSIPTSYIPTTSGTVSRAADVISASGALVSGLIGQTEGTIYAEVDLRNWIASGRILTCSNGTSNERIMIQVGANRTLQAIVTTASADVVNISTASGQVNGIYKCALTYASGDFAFYVNGTQIGTDSSGGVPASTSVFLGKIGTSASTNFLNDRIRAAALYTTRLSNDQLAELTRL